MYIYSPRFKADLELDPVLHWPLKHWVTAFSLGISSTAFLPMPVSPVLPFLPIRVRFFKSAFPEKTVWQRQSEDSVHPSLSLPSSSYVPVTEIFLLRCALCEAPAACNPASKAGCAAARWRVHRASCSQGWGVGGVTPIALNCFASLRLQAALLARDLKSQARSKNVFPKIGTRHH